MALDMLGISLFYFSICELLIMADDYDHLWVDLGLFSGLLTVYLVRILFFHAFQRPFAKSSAIVDNDRKGTIATTALLFSKVNLENGDQGAIWNLGSLSAQKFKEDKENEFHMNIIGMPHWVVDMIDTALMAGAWLPFLGMISEAPEYLPLYIHAGIIMTIIVALFVSFQNRLLTLVMGGKLEFAQMDESKLTEIYQGIFITMRSGESCAIMPEVLLNGTAKLHITKSGNVLGPFF